MGDFSYLRYVPPSVADIPIDWSRVPKETKEHMALWAYDWKKKATRPLPVTIKELADWFDQSKFFGYFDPKLCKVVMDISEFGLKGKGGFHVGPRFYMKYLEQVWYLLFTPGERDCVMGYSHDIIVSDSEDDEVMKEKKVNVPEDLPDEANKEHAEDKGQEKKDKGNEGVKEVKQDKEEMNDEADDEEDDEEDDEDIDDSSYHQRGAAEETQLSQQFDVTLEKEVSRGMAYIVKITHKLGGWNASTLEESLTLAQYAQAVMTLPMSHPAYTSFLSNMLGHR